jgi:DNA-binding transcriptional regulator YiaG
MPGGDREHVARGFRIDREGTRRRRIRNGPTMTPKEIRSRRLALGMSVEELARELAVPDEHVREMESGERPIANGRLLEQVFARRERDQKDHG